MHIIGIFIIGLTIGLIARFIKSNDARFGIIYTTVIGIIGAFFGQFIGQIVGIYRSGDPAEFVGAIVGAILVLAVVEITDQRKISE